MMISTLNERRGRRTTAGGGSSCKEDETNENLVDERWVPVGGENKRHRLLAEV